MSAVRSCHRPPENAKANYLFLSNDKDGWFAFVVIPDFYIFIVDNYINADRHPKCDICDVYAHADLYGLGKGIFPKDKFPKLPAHPHCLCRIKPIVVGMIDMSKQKDNVDKGGKAYINTPPKREQERLLGVHGRNDVMSGKKEWIASARGISDEGFKLRSPASSQRGAINIGKEDYWDSLTSEQKSRDMEAVKYYERLRHEDRAALVEMISESSGMHPKSVYKCKRTGHM